MKTLEKGQDKIKQICKVLKEETLQPAKEEADAILARAKEEAAAIIRKAEQEAEQIHQSARKKVDQERSVFHSSLKQAGKQALESLRQDIEKRLFNTELASLVEKGSGGTQTVAKLIDSIVVAIEREGVKADLTAVVPQSVDGSQVSAAMAQSSVEKLKGKPLQVGNFKGGAQLKWHDRKLTIDISDAALKELLSDFVRKDFRELLFAE